MIDISRNLIVLVFVFISIYRIHAQEFPKKCIGNWSGWMKIYNKGVLKDSVEIEFNVKKIEENDHKYQWVTRYISETHPMVKDYTLEINIAQPNQYILNENNGVKFIMNAVNNKLVSVFKSENIILTSSYELLGNKLIFEVSSGKERSLENSKITTFDMIHTQRVILSKKE